MKLLISTSLSFIAVNIVAVLIALFILAPTINSLLVPHIRTEEDGLNFVGILLGYLIFSAILALALPKIQLGMPWFKKAVFVGLLYGAAVFLAGHIIVAGWSKLDLFAMAFSGFADAFAGIFAAIPVAYIYREEANA